MAFWYLLGPARCEGDAANPVPVATTRPLLVASRSRWLRSALGALRGDHSAPEHDLPVRIHGFVPPRRPHRGVRLDGQELLLNPVSHSRIGWGAGGSRRA